MVAVPSRAISEKLGWCVGQKLIFQIIILERKIIIFESIQMTKFGCFLLDYLSLKNIKSK